MAFRTDLEPGSEQAQLQGCICDHQAGRPAGQPIRVEKCCPIHGLGELKARVDAHALNPKEKP